MGATLQLTSEKGAYTLTDEATYLTWRDRITLVPMVEGEYGTGVESVHAAKTPYRDCVRA